MSSAAFRRALLLLSWRQDVRGGNSALYRGTYFLRRYARHGKRILFQAAYSRTAATHVVAGRAACKLYAHACTRSTTTRFLCASKRWHVTVSYRGGAGKINFANEGRKRTRKRASEKGQQRCGMEAAAGRGGYEMGGMRFPARLLVKRSPHRNSNLFGPFFRATCRWAFWPFFWTRGWTLGDWAMVRALPRTKAQTHKLGCSVEKCFAPGTGCDKKKYMYTFDFGVNVLVKRSSRRTRGLLFIHVRMPPLSRDVCRSLSIFPTGTGIRNIYHYFIQRALCGSDKKICPSYAIVLYDIFVLNSRRYFLQRVNTARMVCMFITYLQL